MDTETIRSAIEQSGVTASAVDLPGPEGYIRVGRGPVGGPGWGTRVYPHLYDTIDELAQAVRRTAEKNGIS
jgi:hypothetical protein